MASTESDTSASKVFPREAKCRACWKTFDTYGTSHLYCRQHADCSTLGRYHIAACTVCCNLLDLAENGSPPESVLAIKSLKEWSFGFTLNSKDIGNNSAYISSEEKKKLFTLYEQLEDPAVSPPAVKKGDASMEKSASPTFSPPLYVKFRLSKRSNTSSDKEAEKKRSSIRKKSMASKNQTVRGRLESQSESPTQNTTTSKKEGRKKRARPRPRPKKLSAEFVHSVENIFDAETLNVKIEEPSSPSSLPSSQRATVKVEEGSSPQATVKVEEEPSPQTVAVESKGIDIDIKEEDVDDYEFIPCDAKEMEGDNVDDDDQIDDNQSDGKCSTEDDKDSRIPDLAISSPELRQHLIQPTLLSKEMATIQEHLASQLIMNLACQANYATLLQFSSVKEDASYPLNLKKSDDISGKKGVSRVLPPPPPLKALNLDDPMLIARHSDSADNPINPSVRVVAPKDISDKDLVSLSVRDLNRLLVNVPKALQNELKRRRRTLKNRSYAQNCRTKRTVYQMQLKTINKQLRKDNNEALEQVTRLSGQIDVYKSENTLLKGTVENLERQLRNTLNELERVKQQSNHCCHCKSHVSNESQ